MATTAAVHLEASDRAIFVGLDGSPAHMVPELTRIVAEGRLEEVFAHSDYLFLGEGYSPSTAAIGRAIPGGVLYREQGAPLTVTLDPATQAPIFHAGDELASPDHKYSITATGAVVVHHRY